MDLETELLRAAAIMNVKKMAMVDILARGRVAFANASAQPDALEIQQWTFSLRDKAPHLFEDTRQAADSPQDLPPTGAGGPVRKRGLVPLSLTPAQTAELETLKPSDRLTKYREYQAAAQQKTPSSTH